MFCAIAKGLCLWITLRKITTRRKRGPDHNSGARQDEHEISPLLP